MTDTTQNIKQLARNSKGHLLPKVIDTPMKPILDALNEALKAIRTRHPEVPNAVLVVGTSSNKKHGHFAQKSWDGKAATHEIMLSGESLRRPAEDVLATLIHESAHALAAAREIKDTSRQGRWHNVKFKALGEELGITLHEDKQIGWSPTTLSKNTAAIYKNELKVLAKALKTYRIPVEATPKAKTTVRIDCGCRGVTVPISFFEKGGLICNECGKFFEDLLAENEDDGWMDENGRDND
jgi:hypothetical protein